VVVGVTVPTNHYQPTLYRHTHKNTPLTYLKQNGVRESGKLRRVIIQFEPHPARNCRPFSTRFKIVITTATVILLGQEFRWFILPAKEVQGKIYLCDDKNCLCVIFFIASGSEFEFFFSARHLPLSGRVAPQSFFARLFLRRVFITSLYDEQFGAELISVCCRILRKKLSFLCKKTLIYVGL